jgi:hypothetical protein
MEIVRNILYPEQFNSKRIRTHPEFEDELKSILERSGYKQRFIKLYRLRLKHLEQYWENCINKKDWFESLKRFPGLYSMRFNNGTKNIRIVFKFTTFEKQQIALLLCTFEEKETKDYRKAIVTATERIEQIQHLLK